MWLYNELYSKLRVHLCDEVQSIFKDEIYLECVLVLEEIHNINTKIHVYV